MDTHRGDPEEGRRSFPWLAPLALFVMTFALRMAPGNRGIVGWDEWILAAIASRWALWFAPYSYPPFHFWVSGALVWLFGPEPIVWRFPSIVSDAGAVALTCLLARRLGGAWAGWSAGLLAWGCLYLAFHETVSLDYMLSFWVLLSLVSYLSAMSRGSSVRLAFAAWCGGMACFTKYHGVVYLATLCALMAAEPDSRRLLRGRWRVIVPGAAIVMPVIMLVIEGGTWRFYGFSKTHLAEVWRVMHWISYVVDPVTGAVENPSWIYYFAHAWKTIGPLWCGLALMGMAFTAVGRCRDGRVLLIVLAAWLLWASTGNLKNARYALPMAYVACVFGGLAIAAVASAPKGRGAAALLLASTLAVGLWDVSVRLRGYLEEERRNAAVYAYINERTPANALLLSEGMAFQADDAVGIAGVKRKVITPETPGCFAKADYAVIDARSFDLLRHRVIPSSPGYVEERLRAARDWPEAFRAGDGRMTVRVLQRPGA